MLKKLLNAAELWVGEKKGMIVNGVPILLLHTETGIYAFNNHCPHAGAWLSEGSLKDNVITCARHGWQFDACSGKGINPTDSQLHSYPLWIDSAQDIWIDLGTKDEQTDKL